MRTKSPIQEFLVPLLQELEDFSIERLVSKISLEGLMVTDGQIFLIYLKFKKLIFKLKMKDSSNFRKLNLCKVSDPFYPHKFLQFIKHNTVEDFSSHFVHSSIEVVL